MATPTDLGGYEYKFVKDPPDTLVCKICHHPCRVPYLTGCCGHNFCKSCLDAAKMTVTCCPYCRNEEDFTLFNNKLSDREIRSLHVMCTNKERGCEWQDELNNINNHLGNSNGCQFEDVSCSNECGKMLQRRYLTSHIETECPRRKVDCQYCHFTGEHQFIEGEHKEQCPKLPLPCPNKCEVGSVPREDMEAHRKECPLQMVQCEYHNVGCEDRMMRKDLEKHIREKIEMHLTLATSEFSNIKAELAETRSELAETRSELADTKSELASAKSELKSQIANSNKQINTLIVTLHQILLRQGQTESAESVVSVADWSVKIKAMAALIKSGDQECSQSVIVNIPEFFKNKCSQVDINDWYSDSFYSHKRGYKMCLCVYPTGHGTGKGTHLSVYLHLMKGPHDDELTWPLRGKFEVKLLNQISDCEHHSVTITYNNCTNVVLASRVTDGDKAKGWGKPKFISHEGLHKATPTCQYLKDDCIFLQVSKL